MTMNYAHRGASGYYPENTLISFRKALEMGCTGIETDVQMTRDGVLVLIHDEMVNRTTNGTGPVGSFTLQELRHLDAGSFFGKNFAGCRIPTLEELLELVSPTPVMLDIEIKTGIVFYPQIEEKLLDTLYRYQMQHRVILSSFNHYSMVHCKELAPEVKTALLYMEGLYKPEQYCHTTGADALHPFFYAVQPEIVQAAHQSGLLVNPFTVNEERVMQNLLQMGVDGIITDYPDKLKTLLEG